MNRKIVPFCHPRQVRAEIRERACAWISELDTGLTLKTRAELEAWLAENPAHVRELLEVAKFWDQMGVLSELSKLVPLEQYKPLAGQVHRRRKRVVAAVGALATAVLAGLLWKGLDMSVELAPLVERQELYSTEVGQQLSLELSDGSEVILNTDTFLEVRYSSTERRIVLERGEAYFTVAADAAKPFRVQAGERLIEAVGTAFSVFARLDAVEVTVTEGRVNVVAVDELPASRQAPRDASQEGQDRSEVDRDTVSGVALLAGEHVSVSRSDGEIQRRQIRHEEIEARLAWRHGMLLFQGDPLQSVLREVSRYTTIRIEAEAAIHDMPVNGYFRAGDIERLIAAMQTNFSIEATRIGEDRILLTAP